MKSTVQCCERNTSKKVFKPDFTGKFRKLLGKIGNTNLLIIGLFIAIAFFIPGHLMSSGEFTIKALVSISPYLIFSVLLAAYLKAAGADKIIARVFSGHLISTIFAASIFGALSPFCSCGVIPLIAALLASGVPLPAVMAFWLSSPVMSPDMFVLTAGALGMEFAIAKTFAAVGIGLLGGFGIRALQKVGTFSKPLKQQTIFSCGCESKSIIEGETEWLFWSNRERRKTFGVEFWKTGVFLVQWLVFAFALESLMIRYLPPETVTRLIDPEGLLVIPMASIIGVPAYLNGFAAIPVASGLMNAGFPPGAVLTFMTAGAMTSIPAAIAVYTLVKRSVFSWYLALSLIGATIVGYGYQLYLG